MEIPSFTMPAFPHINASLVINTPVLIVVLVLFFLVYAIVTGVLIYHWSAYGMKSHGVLVAETLFVFVSLVLFVVSGLSIYYF